MRRRLIFTFPHHEREFIYLLDSRFSISRDWFQYSYLSIGIDDGAFEMDFSFVRSRNKWLDNHRLNIHRRQTIRMMNNLRCEERIVDDGCWQHRMIRICVCVRAPAINSSSKCRMNILFAIPTRIWIANWHSWHNLLSIKSLNKHRVNLCVGCWCSCQRFALLSVSMRPGSDKIHKSRRLPVSNVFFFKQKRTLIVETGEPI